MIDPYVHNLGRENGDLHSAKMNDVQALPCSFEVEKRLIQPPRENQQRDELGRFCRKATGDEF
jgi:hypothetical protein